METEATQVGAEDPIIAAIDERMSPVEIQEEPEANQEETEAVAETPEVETPEDIPEDEAVEEYELDAAAVASMLDIEEDSIAISDDGKISLNTKIDGESGRANLAELLKSYQLEGHVNKRSMELADQRKQFDTERETAVQAFNERLTVVDQLITQNENQILAEYQGINWAELEANDPGRFAAMQQKYGVRYQQVQQAKEQANQVLARQRQEMAQRQGQAQQQVLSQEREALVAARPSWSDQAAFETDRAAIIDYGKTHGLTEEELMGITDHRFLLILDDARKVGQIQKKAEIAKKKVKRVPKVLKPGAAQSKQQQRKTKQSTLRQQVKKTGSIDDVAALLLDRMG